MTVVFCDMRWGELIGKCGNCGGEVRGFYSPGEFDTGGRMKKKCDKCMTCGASPAVPTLKMEGVAT